MRYAPPPYLELSEDGQEESLVVQEPLLMSRRSVVGTALTEFNKLKKMSPN